MLNRCKYLDVQVNSTNPTWSMHYCRLLQNQGINDYFLKIATRIKELSMEYAFIPNGECPWVLHNECEKCPLYDPRHKDN